MPAYTRMPLLLSAPTLLPINQLHRHVPNIGLCYYKLSNNEDAASYYKRSLTIKPDYTQALIQLGNSYDNLKRTDDAVAAYQKALQRTQ